MSEHELKELLKKSSHKPQAAEQNAPTTAEGAQHDVARLQRLVGNRALQRMLADNTVSIHQRTGTTVQAKMTVGAANDAFEQEADAVANQVMTKRDVVQRAGEEEELQMKRIQREEGGEEEEEELQMKRVDIQREAEEEELQMKRIQREDEMPVDKSGSFDASSSVESRISAKAGSGQTIPDVNRDLFESSMGRDFSGVNVHTDSESDNLNKELGARAFTTGNDIFFRSGEYNPGSSDGQRLLAHELTHVVQQGGAGLKKKADEE